MKTKLDIDKEHTTHHLPLLQLRHILLEDEPPLGLDLSLLPDRMLREELVCCSKGRVMENIRVSLEHVANGGT